MEIRHRLKDGEVGVIRTRKGSAPYTGIQLTDGWMIASDGRKHITSINISQAKPDGDGNYTFVISPSDPGAANWLDTDGLKEGNAILRWQALPPGATADGLLQEYKVISLAELKDAWLKGVPTLTPAERAAQQAAHAAQYDLRTQGR